MGIHLLPEAAASAQSDFQSVYHVPEWSLGSIFLAVCTSETPKQNPDDHAMCGLSYMTSAPVPDLHGAVTKPSSQYLPGGPGRGWTDRLRAVRPLRLLPGAPGSPSEAPEGVLRSLVHPGTSVRLSVSCPRALSDRTVSAPLARIIASATLFGSVSYIFAISLTKMSDSDANISGHPAKQSSTVKT